MGRDTNGMTSFSVPQPSWGFGAQVLSQISQHHPVMDHKCWSQTRAYQGFQTYTKGKEYDRKCPRPGIRGRAPGSVLPATNWKLPRPGIAYISDAEFKTLKFSQIHENPHATRVKRSHSYHVWFLFVENRGQNQVMTPHPGFFGDTKNEPNS